MSIPREPAFDDAEYRQRFQRVQTSMAEKSLDALLLFSPHNVFYLSGMDSENLFDYQCLLVPQGQDPVLIISHFEEARSENSCWLETVRAYGPFEDPIDATIDAVRDLNLQSSSLGMERRSRGLSVDFYEKLRSGLDGATLSDGFGPVEKSRLVKSEAEIAYMRKAAQLTDLGVNAGYEAMAQGVPDYEIGAAIVDAMYRSGGDTVCWGPIVAAGYRAGCAHSTFNGHRLNEGEAIFLEVTGEVTRYTAPLMRTAILGEPTPEMLQVEDAVMAALDIIVEKARPGAIPSDVAGAARGTLDPILKDYVFHYNFGYPVGIGYPPSWIEELDYFIRDGNARPFEAGMLFHLPMSIRKYGEHAVNLSHTILVGEEHTAPISSSPARLHRVI